jgi:hypothetical protein
MIPSTECRSCSVVNVVGRWFQHYLADFERRGRYRTICHATKPAFPDFSKYPGAALRVHLKESCSTLAARNTRLATFSPSSLSCETSIRWKSRGNTACLADLARSASQRAVRNYIILQQPAPSAPRVYCFGGASFCPVSSASTPCRAISSRMNLSNFSGVLSAAGGGAMPSSAIGFSTVSVCSTSLRCLLR